MEISTVKDAMEKPLEPKVMDLEEVRDFFSAETRKFSFFKGLRFLYTGHFIGANDIFNFVI